jgi:enolase
MFNLINGGRYGTTEMPVQEFLVVPTAAETYSQALTMGVEVYYQLGPTIEKRYGRESLYSGSLAGYGAPVADLGEVIETLLEAAESAAYAGAFRIGLDCAASHFYDASHDRYRFLGGWIDRWRGWSSPMVSC